MSELARRTSNRTRVLAYLQAHGSATNVELAEIGGLRAMARVHELQQTHRIDVRHVRGGLWKISYRGVRSAPVQESLFEAGR